MKIGILTLHFGANYGGTLQCISLFNILKNMGNEVEVIDFRPHMVCSLPIRLLYKLFSIRSVNDVKNLICHLEHKKDKVLNNKLLPVFDKFRKTELKLSESCDEVSISRIAESYDLIIVGSDQVWSSTVRNKLTYMGDWSPSFKGQLYSYAACATILKYPYIRKRKITKLLDNFEFISVRDECSKAFVEQFINKNNIRVHLDPTLLYSFEKMIPSTTSTEKYILVYVLGKEIVGGNITAISRIKDIVGNDIKTLAVTIYDEDVNYVDETIKTASPAEWMWYIKNAQFIFTDSFHGEVFSIKFNKDFYVYYVEENRASRIKTLSKMFNVEDRMITNAKCIDGNFKRKIDTTNFDEMKALSISYLKNITQ